MVSDELRAEIQAQLPQMIDECMAFFKGIKIEETQECLLAALRRLDDPPSLEFGSIFHYIYVYWRGISPDECLRPLRFNYVWLCSISLARDRRTGRTRATREDLGEETRELIEQQPTMMELAEAVPCGGIDADYRARISGLTSPADRAAELRAALRWEMKMLRDEFVLRTLQERLQLLFQEKVTDDAAATRQVKELEEIVEELIRFKMEPGRLGLKGVWYVYELFTVIRAIVRTGDEAQYLSAAKALVAELRRTGHLPCGGGMNSVAKQKLALALQAASRIPGVRELNLCPEGEEASAFLAAAVGEWAKGRSGLNGA